MDSQLESHVRRAAQVLMSFGAREVYLFGSQASSHPAPSSDLDLAVRGLPDAVFFEAYARASLGFPREMDLVSLDEKNPFTEYLIQEGRLVRID